MAEGYNPENEDFDMDDDMNEYNELMNVDLFPELIATPDLYTKETNTGAAEGIVVNENFPIEPIGNEVEKEAGGAVGGHAEVPEDVGIDMPEYNQVVNLFPELNEMLDHYAAQTNTGIGEDTENLPVQPIRNEAENESLGARGNVGFPGAAGSTDANVPVLPPQEEQPLRRSKRRRQQRLEAIDDSDVQLNTEDAATSRQRVIDPQLEPSAPRRRGWKRMKVAPAQRQQRENESLGAVGGHVGFPGVEPPAPRRSGWKRVEVAPAQKPGKKKGRKPSVATLYCDICNKHFENKRAQQQHNYRRHKERPTPICGQCGKSFATKGSLKEHIQGAHENVGEQQCTFGCGAKFPTMKTRVRHETRRHTIKKCVCGKECKGSLSFLDHTKQCVEAQAQAPAELRCEECEEEFAQRYDLTRHMYRKHNKVHCDICDEYLDGENEKRKHNRKHHKK